MKFLVNYNVSEEIIHIEDVEYLGDFKINLIFNDGISKTVDFKNFLKKSLHSSLKKYQNQTESQKFQLIDGNLNWNDYEMIFPVADLYEGNI